MGPHVCALSSFEITLVLRLGRTEGPLQSYVRGASPELLAFEFFNI